MGYGPRRGLAQTGVTGLFFAGQSRMFRNPLSLNGFSFGSAPAQPARQEGWNARANPPDWPERPRFDVRKLKLPRSWNSVVEQPLRAEAVARRPRARVAR